MTEVAATPVAKRKRRFPWGKLIVLLIIVALATTTVVYRQKYEHLRSDPTAATENQTKALLSDVGKVYNLPTGETPTIATVTDPSKLKNQAFFANAKKGDKIIIYTAAKKVIMYRPSTKQIINVGPIAPSSGSSSGDASSK